jgi:hypothetical protein
VRAKCENERPDARSAALTSVGPIFTRYYREHALWASFSSDVIDLYFFAPPRISATLIV